MTQPNRELFFSIDDAGWCQPARHSPSPHHNERADPSDISLLVIHGISLPPGQFGGPYIDHLFLGKLDPDAHPYFAAIHQLQVSAHCLIRRDGEVVQYVPFNARAWHAGVSHWQGREACNDFSIGIELEGTDELPYTDAQYHVLAALSHAICAHYPAITPTQIVGHCDIAPGRKTDPGDSFDWPRYRSAIIT
ncbi:1,6-anhydro-N-acetylmuramyl-L-alanine amidase AmpD [Aeromonas cavernicola]|uniref:1,6-anhydro-N-acetylmuramyl-L-alanine amidase AmpD n=1 Tax=Aeromonas cavernicola TaxID=1006623 RepID=A0A2H9U764_9GAMM|nr:1,6-anhydro-N-acetylmuramyl-L-alanine amidase AmpD [Aeromonas cavernicola]PJG59870.1 1,6-anhydro-N-acetylmuramyl-L-alanine amidase AmpD [Aeromonas cavernicola]